MSVACLMAFVQDNFTGPDLDKSSEEFRLKTFDESNEERWNVDRISIDGIELNTNIRHIPLLIISRNFLEDLYAQFPSDLVSCHLLRIELSFASHRVLILVDRRLVSTYD